MTMALLSRTAEHLYWLGRHTERIEWSARIVREHTRLLVDLPVDVESDWSTLLAITGDPIPTAPQNGRVPGEIAVINHLVASQDNPGSVVRTIVAARENLRVTRTVVPWAAWETLNSMHLAVRTLAPSSLARSARLELCDLIIESCRKITGIITDAMSRDQGYALYQIGRRMERSDMMARVLDVRAGGLLVGSGDATAPADRSPFEDVRWLGILRTADALQMYHRKKTASVDAERVLDFLIHDVEFPRSIARCALDIAEALDVLPIRREASLAHERLIHVLAQRPDTSNATTLHDRLDAITGALDDLHDAVCESYLVPRTHEIAAV